MSIGKYFTKCDLIERMRDDFKLVAKIFDSIIKPREGIPWKEYICDGNMNSVLLDVGGGTGRITQAFQDCHENIIIYDLSLPMLNQSKIKNTDITCICGEVENISFRMETFDHIIMVDTLHHIKHQKQGIDMILSVLKPGGIFILEEPDIRKFPVKLIAIMEKILLMRSHFLKPEIIDKWLDHKRFNVRFFEEDDNYYFVIQKNA